MILSDYQNNQIETNTVQFVHVYIFGKIKLIILGASDSGEETQITDSGFYEKLAEKQLRFYEQKLKLQEQAIR